jgi:signal transduction histidine kinase
MIASWPKAATAIGRAPVSHGQAAVAQAGVPRLAEIVGADGETRIVADTGLRAPGVPLHIAVAQDKTSVLKPWRAMLIATIITTTVSLLIIAAIAILLMRWLVWEERWRRALIDHQNHISKQAVDLTVARDHAETAQRTRGQFLANMSHELRTPLNAVIGFSDIFRQELFGPLGSARYIEYANDIHRSGEHLLDIINNILDLTKIDSGRFELATEPVDIAELVRFCCRLVAESVQAGDLSLSMDAPDDLPTVDGDLIRLRQILFNLLSNAIKFTPAGGRILVTADRAGDMIRLRVADTGIGMTAEEIRLAMQPFYQVDNGITRRYQGTGLGLPLTKSLVDLHDGRMEIESAPKKGTTVSVYLKASQSGRQSFDRDAAA